VKHAHHLFYCVDAVRWNVQPNLPWEERGKRKQRQASENNIATEIKRHGESTRGSRKEGGRNWTILEDRFHV